MFSFVVHRTQLSPSSHALFSLSFLPLIARWSHCIRSSYAVPCTVLLRFLPGALRPLDELCAQKLKYKAISEELDHALGDMTSLGGSWRRPGASSPDVHLLTVVPSLLWASGSSSFLPSGVSVTLIETKTGSPHRHTLLCFLCLPHSSRSCEPLTMAGTKSG